MTARTWSFSYFPKDYHKDNLIKISQILKKGETVQLIGAPGSGTSALVRLITQVPKIKNIYFPKSLNFNFLLLDGNFLLERNSLTLSRLFLSLFGTQADIPEDNVGINQKLEEEISRICSKGNLVLIIDHIQELDYPELAPFFANLSYVYRRFRPNLNFIFISDRLLRTRADLENFKDLGRFLTSNIISISNLNQKDSFWFIKDVEKQVRLHLNKEEETEIFKISSGFPRTMKRLVEAVSKGFSIDELMENPNLFPALAIHLDELSESGGMIQESPILIAYRNSLSDKDKGDHFENIKFNQRLTKLEDKLLKFFLLKKGEVVVREDGIEKLWGENAVAISDHAYDQIVHRLRGKLRTSIPKVELETIKGRGHCLRI